MRCLVLLGHFLSEEKTKNFSKIRKCQERGTQWRIQGGRPRRAPPTAQNFLNFMQFLGKFDKIVCWHPLPPRGSVPPVPPPTGNPGSTPAAIMLTCHFANQPSILLIQTAVFVLVIKNFDRICQKTRLSVLKNNFIYFNLFVQAFELTNSAVFAILISGGSKGGAGDAPPPPPPGVQILSISCSFWEISAKSYVGTPPGSWRPSSGKSWIRHC